MASELANRAPSSCVVSARLKVVTSDQRRWAANFLRAEGVHPAMMADAFGCSVRTIYRDLALTKSSDPHTERFRRSLIVEAGVCFMKRYGEAPTTVTWNPTLAFQSNEQRRRWSLEGWRAVHDPETQRPWPHEQEAGRLWRTDGGFQAFVAAVRTAFTGRLKSYVPVPLPRDHLARCALGARFPAPPGLTRANLWAAFALLGPGYESLHAIHHQRPHSDVWLRERSDARRHER